MTWLWITLPDMKRACMAAVVGILVVLMTGCGDSASLDTKHDSLDAYVLSVDPPAPQEGADIKLQYPAELSGSKYVGRLVLDLEHEDSPGKWVLVARLATSMNADEKPTVLPAKQGDSELTPTGGRPVGDPVRLVLPEKLDGTYRIVDVVVSPQQPSDVRTLAAKFAVNS